MRFHCLSLHSQLIIPYLTRSHVTALPCTPTEHSSPNKSTARHRTPLRSSAATRRTCQTARTWIPAPATSSRSDDDDEDDDGDGDHDVVSRPRPCRRGVSGGGEVVCDEGVGAHCAARCGATTGLDWTAVRELPVCCRSPRRNNCPGCGAAQAAAAVHTSSRSEQSVTRLSFGGCFDWDEGW